MAPSEWWFSVINSILRNLSELGLRIQQFQSDQEEAVVLQGRAGDDHLLQFHQQCLYWHRKIHPLQKCIVSSVPASKKRIISVWKIDIVDNIVKQASSINSVFCVHLGYHRTQGSILSHTQTDWFWYEGASLLSVELTGNVFYKHTLLVTASF